MGSPCTRRAWSGSMMGRFGCGTQVWRSETPISHTGSARRDSQAPKSTCATGPRPRADTERRIVAMGSASRVSSSSSPVTSRRAVASMKVGTAREGFSQQQWEDDLCPSNQCHALQGTPASPEPGSQGARSPRCIAASAGAPLACPRRDILGRLIHSQESVGPPSRTDVPAIWDYGETHAGPRGLHPH